MVCVVSPQHVMEKEVSAYNHIFLSVIPSHCSKQTHMEQFLYAEQINEYFLLYVFQMEFKICLF